MGTIETELSLEEAMGKTTKDLANYRVGDETIQCGTCVNFSAPDECVKVKGVVAATGVCDLHEQKVVAESAESEEALMAQLFGGEQLG